MVMWMSQKLLIASFDMEVGGVERSLISLLHHLNYERFETDIMLYSHTGDFMQMLPKTPNLLKEIKEYKTFRMPIGRIFKEGFLPIGLARLLAKTRASLQISQEKGYKQMQYMWEYALPFLPKLEKTYDMAISFLWPHYFVAKKVNAKKKIAWIHTDFSTVDTDMNKDIKMWQSFDYIVAVSEACKQAFVTKYPALKKKVVVIENIHAPEVIRALAKEPIRHPMLDDSRFKIVTVARLSHAKGIDQAVRAMKIVRDRGYQDIAWYVVGYGGDEAMIKDLIQQYQLEDAFILVGKQLNPYVFIEAADLYVQPSRYEGKAVTVSEAQILGKPVLITNYPTANSQLTDGVDGMICDLSIEGIANGIELLYQKPELRVRLSRNCKNRDYQNHQELEKLYALV
jgi:glycosyltransferase involved in cell wall biosynthesis